MKKIIYHQYPFTNDYMFATIMNNPDHCKELLKRILPERKIKNIKVLSEPFLNNYERVDTQHTIIIDVISKGVTLDVIFEDEDSVYNIEMQCIKEPELFLRSRYYSSQLDMEQISKGENYSKLKDTYVIFLCTFDPFKEGKSIYTFESYDINHQLKLHDGRYILYVNPTSVENGISKELTNLFEYMLYNQVDDEDSFLCELEDEISILNREDGQWRRHIMRLEEKIEMENEKAVKRGIEIGEERGIKKANILVAKKLKAAGLDFKEISDISTLSIDEIEKL